MTKSQVLLTIGLFSGVFVTGMDSFIISPLLPIIADSLSTTVSTTAYGITIYALFYTVGSPFWGPLGDRFNKKILLQLGLLVFLVGTWLCTFTSNLVSFYIYRAIAGLGAAIFVPNVWALIGATFKPQMRNQIMGIVLSALSLSIAIGIPIGSLISQLSNWRVTFLASSLLGVLALILITYCVPSIKVTVTSRSTTYWQSISTIWQTTNVFKGLLTTLFWMLGFYSLYTFLGTFLTMQFNLKTGQIGIVFMVYGLANFLTSFLGGTIMNKIGQYYCTVLGSIVSILAISVMLLTTQLTVFTIAMISLAFAQGVGVTALNTFLVSLDPTNRSTVMAFNSSSLYLGLTAGSSIGGILFSSLGFTAVGMIAILGFITTLGLTTWIRLSKHW